MAKPSETPKSRRNFLKICGSMLAAAATGTANVSAAPVSRHARVKLMRDGRQLRADDLQVGRTYIFNYPYVTTPCMLVNLGKRLDAPVELQTEAGQRYVWRGGIGPDRSIVSYSAICAHRMTYTAKSVSFINYRHSAVVYFDEHRQKQERSQIIYCCSERSVYDPAKGAQVIGGPAPQPLAAISLDYEESDGTLHANGTTGGELFEQFLEKFEFRLQLDFRMTDISAPVVNQAEVLSIEEYSDTIIYC